MTGEIYHIYFEMHPKIPANVSEESAAVPGKGWEHVKETREKLAIRSPGRLELFPPLG